MSDGRSIVVAAHEEDRWVLVAVDLRVGAVRWTAAAPAAVGAPSVDALVTSTRWLHVVGGEVVVGVPGRLVGLAPSAGPGAAGQR